jgi:hypothetical protein
MIVFLVLCKKIGVSFGGGNRVPASIISLVFISLLLALRLAQFIFLQKIDGDWTKAGKTRWRYCFIGAIAVAFISVPIEYLNIGYFLKTTFEIIIIMVVAYYFYGKYWSECKDTAKKKTNSRSQENTGYRRLIVGLEDKEGRRLRSGVVTLPLTSTPPNSESHPKSGEMSCPICSATYSSSDYLADAVTWTCSSCKGELPKPQENTGYIRRIIKRVDKNGQVLDSFVVTQPLTSIANMETPPKNKEG